ncbi:MAG: bifunctional serine/threonine-protein kinase/formylglycine-generating enzyme family protein, partial [Planctomycetota bacterium]
TQIALQNRFVTPEQIEECQSIQKKRDRQVPLGMILIEKGYINDQKLNLITEIRLNQKLDESCEDFVVLTCPECRVCENITPDQMEQEFYCKFCGVLLNSPLENAAEVLADSDDEVEYIELGEIGDSFIGQTLYGYQVLEHIGEGGMADVYKALHLQTQTIVAIKLLKPLASQERFIREIQHLSVINHPNVIRVFYRGKYEKQYFYIMEYLEGKNLLESINQEIIPFSSAFKILKQIVFGLQAVHEKGIWHRDIKPSNIMICQYGDDLVAKIMDFGVARSLGDSDFTAPGQLVGTFKYMSPEQIRGQELDGRADIFSLGILAYEMFARQEPFPVKESLGYLHANIILEAPPLTQKNQELPEKLCQIIHKMIAKDKKDRYFTPNLILDLERFEQSQKNPLLPIETKDSTSIFYRNPAIMAASSGNEVPFSPSSIPESLILLHPPEIPFEQLETQHDFSEFSLPLPIPTPLTETILETNPILDQGTTSDALARQIEELIESEPTTEQQKNLSEASNQEDLLQNDLDILYQELKTARSDEDFKKRIFLLEEKRQGVQSKFFLKQIDRELCRSHLRWGKLHQEESETDRAKRIYLRGLCFYTSEYTPQILQTLREIDRTLQKMEYVPPGEYPVEEDGKQKRTLPGFLMDKMPVTNQQYYQFLRVSGNKAPIHWESGGLYPPATEAHPMIYVSYKEALAFAQWFGKTLPSEEEWEYAARGSA